MNKMIKKFENYEESYEEIEYDYFTVGDLIEHLRQFDTNLPVGASGHFGEFHSMSPGSFGKSQAKHNPDGKDDRNDDWTNNDFPYGDILNVYCPDLGPDPD